VESNDCAILYSGGSDSTLAVILMQEQYQKIHLLTYKRFGLFSLDNTTVYVDYFKEKYGKDKFVHTFMNIDKLFKYLSYESYIKNLIRHRFFLLTTCGFCKLAMHVRTIVYCLVNNVKHVCDGANKGMDIYPGQMSGVLNEITKLYEIFGIHYFNPVFDYEPPEEKSYIKDDTFRKRIGNYDNTPALVNKNTTERKLYELGITPSENVKGSEYDKKRQGRCFQLILFRIFANKYFLASKTIDEYVEKVGTLYNEKIAVAKKLIDDYINQSKRSKLFV